jgi:hypothetical protein
MQVSARGAGWSFHAHFFDSYCRIRCRRGLATPGMLLSQWSPGFASRGVDTPYSAATSVDIPSRVSINSLFDGLGAEPPLSGSSRRSSLNYPNSFVRPDLLSLSLADIVVVGSPVRIRSHLSNDLTTVYSEITLKVTQVLWSARSVAGISPGSSILVERAGGVVKLSSGAILIRGCMSEGIPYNRFSHLIVAKYRPAAGVFSLVTGFELNGDQVYGLENVTRQSSGRAALNQYPGTSAQFLDSVRKQIAALQQ